MTSWSDLVVALKLNPLTRFDLNILYINVEPARDPAVTQVEEVPVAAQGGGIKEKGLGGRKKRAVGETRLGTADSVCR